MVKNYNDVWMIPAKNNEKNLTLIVNHGIRILSKTRFQTGKSTSPNALYGILFKNKDPGEMYSCSCQIGSPYKPCKHNISLMVNAGMLKYPPEAISKKLDSKRTPGRRRKVTGGTALQKE